MASMNTSAEQTQSSFKKIEDLIEALGSEMTPETTVLVKGSRFMRMERVSNAVSDDANAKQAEGNK